MNCHDCFLYKRPVENQNLKSPVCNGKLLKPKTKEAFDNATANSGIASICRCSPYRQHAYHG